MEKFYATFAKKAKHVQHHPCNHVDFQIYARDLVFEIDMHAILLHVIEL